MMSLRDNKLLLLRQLGMESEPISLTDLLKQMGNEFKERTVRRWLQELINEGKVKKIGQKRASKYLVAGRQEAQVPGEQIRLDQTRLDQAHLGQAHLDQAHVDSDTKHPNNLISSHFSSKSLSSIKHIKRPLFEREPVAYKEDWLKSYEPNQDFYLPLQVRQLLLKAGARAGEQDPAGTYAHQIFNRLLIDLSYNSSRLEGNTYSLLDTARLLIHGDSPEGKLDEEKIMILNHKEAIRYLVENAPKLVINSTVIYTLHYLLADGLVEPQEAGKVRRHAVRVSGSVYIPFEDPNQLELHLKKISKKAAAIHDPYEQSMFLLAHISYLQAFADVNKRTARLASNIPLIKHNLVPLAFSDIPVDDYMSAVIAIYEQQEIQPLTDLYVYSYLRTCAAYDATIQSMGFDEVRVRYRQQRRDIIRAIIAGELIGNEVTRYIKEETKRTIPETVQKAFIEDVQEDLSLIDESRIVGMGITAKQLHHWLKKRNSLL